VLGKNADVYLWILNGKQLFFIKTKDNTMENEKIIATNGPRNFIFLYNSKGELDIVIY
jgi:hypothetical protein